MILLRLDTNMEKKITLTQYWHLRDIKTKFEKRKQPSAAIAGAWYHRRELKKIIFEILETSATKTTLRNKHNYVIDQRQLIYRKCSKRQRISVG